MSPEDLGALGITHGQNVKVATETGSVIVKAVIASQPLPRGVIFMPYGPWANMLISTETYGTGMPPFKGIKAEVTAAANDKILDVKTLVEQVTRG